jgi:hypothetical protein
VLEELPALHDSAIWRNFQSGRNVAHLWADKLDVPGKILGLIKIYLNAIKGKVCLRPEYRFVFYVSQKKVEYQERAFQHRFVMYGTRKGGKEILIN